MTSSMSADALSADPFDEVIHERAVALMARYPQARSALLPMLHLVQSVHGHVGQQGIEFCAEKLDLTTAEVSAVASFYSMYKRRPCGEHLVSVCTNTLCATVGGDDIYKMLQTELGNDATPLGQEETCGEPGSAGSITLEHVECLAACDFGPVMQVNYEYYDNQSTESALELVRSLQAGDRPLPTRGAPLTDFRHAELQLAGFFDETAGADDPSAAPATLRGVAQAHENGWQAPAMPDGATELHDLPPVPEKK